MWDTVDGASAEGGHWYSAATNRSLNRPAERSCVILSAVTVDIVIVPSGKRQPAGHIDTEAIDVRRLVG